jgi:hypothetical protein
MAKRPPKPPAAPAGDYDDFKKKQADISRKRSATGREVGPLPEIANPKRRARGRKSLKDFARTYFPNRFKLKFSTAHLDAITLLQACTDRGGLSALAMSRGFGKTTLAEVAVLRAVLYGLRRFVVLICATMTLAKKRLKAILRELEGNDLLAADFPEACHCIRALGRIHNRASGQTLGGEPTRIEMTAETVTLPTVKGAACSGAVIQVSGMEGAFRGLNVSGPDGSPMRPDLVVLDDVQTRESARSPAQTAEREAIITGDVLGLAGPDTVIACILLCTVIYPNDLSDRFLDHERHPEWQGVRTKMLAAMPANLALWDEYAEARRDGFRASDGGKAGNDFYRLHRAELDAGAVATWAERKKPGELSAIQSAMNLYYRDRRAFLSEYQNEPERDSGPVSGKELVPAEVVKRLSGVARGGVPTEAVRLTAFIDCGAELHWYAVVGWTAGFGGSVIDYGPWPRQARSVFAASEPRPGLSDVYRERNLSESARVYAGLTSLADAILGVEYTREGSGEKLRVERCLVDAGWQSQTVYSWCRQTPHYGVVFPSKGIGRTATARGVSEWKPRPGERSGWHWRLTMSETGKGRMCQFDPDAWKSFVWERLTAPMGGAGCLTLHGRDPIAHELLAEHLAAESSEPMTVRGQTFDKWTVKPHRPDNHLFDTLIGAAVAAGVQGLAWNPAEPGSAPPRAEPARKRTSLAERVELRRREKETAARGDLHTRLVEAAS